MNIGPSSRWKLSGKFSVSDVVTLSGKTFFFQIEVCLERQSIFHIHLEIYMKQKILQILPVFGQNPEVGEKPLVNEGRKCDVSGDFFLFLA